MGDKSFPNVSLYLRAVRLGHTVGSGSSLMRLSYSLVSLPPAAFNGLKRFSAPGGRLSLLFRACLRVEDRDRQTESRVTSFVFVCISLHLLKAAHRCSSGSTLHDP